MLMLTAILVRRNCMARVTQNKLIILFSLGSFRLKQEKQFIEKKKQKEDNLYICTKVWSNSPRFHQFVCWLTEIMQIVVLNLMFGSIQIFFFFLKNSGILFQIVGLIQKWSFSSVLVSRKRCFNPRSLFLVFTVFCWSENFIHLSLEFILNKIEYWWADLLLERLIYWQQGQFFEALIPCMFPRV